MAFDNFGTIIADLPLAAKVLLIVMGVVQFSAVGFWLSMTAKEMKEAKVKNE